MIATRVESEQRDGTQTLGALTPRASWRIDLSLVESFDLFRARFEVFKEKGEPLGLLVPPHHLHAALNLHTSWPHDVVTFTLREADKNHGEILAHDLSREGRFVARVVPYTLSDEEIVFVNSLESGDEMLQRIFDKTNQELAGVERSLTKQHPLVERAGSGIKPYQVFNVLPQVNAGEFYFNEATGMVETQAIGINFDPDTGVLTVTDRAEQVYNKLQDVFHDATQPPNTRLIKTNELVAA